MFVEMR